MALSAEQILVIRNYVTELQRTNPNNWVNDLAAAMDQFDVSPSMLQEAYSDISVSQIQDTYNQSRPSGKFSTARPQDVGPPSPTTTAPPPPPQEKITIRPEAIQNIEQPVQSSQTTQDPTLVTVQPQPVSAVNNIEKQLRAQYDAVIAQLPELKYRFEDRLDRIFKGQAEMLADAGITDITQVGRKFEYLGGEGAGPPRVYSGGLGGTDVGMESPEIPLGSSYLIDKRTGKKLELDKSYEGNFKIEPQSYLNLPNLSANTPADQVKTPDVQFWGSAGLGSGSDQFLIVWNDKDQPVFLPTWDDSKKPSFTDALEASAKFLAPFFIPGIGEALHSTAFGQAIGATASTVLAGGVIGATIAELSGGNPVTGFVTGGLSAFGTNAYATNVGNALGVYGAAAPIVGNAVLNAGISGLIASATGANVEKSMLTGGLVGGAIASAPKIANTLLGGEANVKSISTSLGMGLLQTQELIATSIADAIIAEAQGVDGFGSALGKSLVSRGVGTVVANQAVNLVSNNITQDPESLRFVFDTTRGAAGVAVNAALNKQDVGDALKFAAPSIILQASLSFSEVPQDQVAQLPPSEGVMVAGPPSAETLAQIQSQPTVSERAIFSNFIDTEDGGFQQTRVQGTRNDGSIYEYDIFTYEDGKVAYAAYNSDLQSEHFNIRPNLTNRNDLGLTTQEVASRNYTAGIDLRDTSGTGGAGRAVIGGGGTDGGGNAVGFNFIGLDSDGRKKYDIGGDSFTLFVVDNQNILRNDKSFVELIPIVRPSNPTDPNSTPVVDLKENPDPKVPPKPPPKPPPEPPPEPPPPPPPPPPPEPIPVSLKPGTAAEKKEGATGAKGAEGASGTPGGAAPGTLQEALRFELNLLESRLQNTAQERNETQNNLNRALEQRERLREQGLLAALGPDLQDMLDAEIATLEEQIDAISATESSLGTRISDIGAPQQGKDGQEGDKGRPSSKVIGNLVQGGFGTGLPGDEGAGTGGLGGGFGPGAGEEGDETGSGIEGEGPGSGTEGFGSGAGREGEGTGGGGEGEGGVTDTPPLRPVTIFDSLDGRPATPFSSRVTGEALAGILGAKEPLFGGDPDEQRAVWNRRSLRLRRALGL
jgi:hypothetical protein